MSEKLKRCSLCEEGEFIPVCDVCGAIGTNTRAYEEELAALREENERLRQLMQLLYEQVRYMPSRNITTIG